MFIPITCLLFNNLCCCDFKYMSCYLGLPSTRSSQRRFSIKKGVLKNFAKFTGKYLCQNFSFNRVAGLKPASLLKKRLRNRRLLVNCVKHLRTPVLQNIFASKAPHSTNNYLFTHNQKRIMFFEYF